MPFSRRRMNWRKSNIQSSESGDYRFQRVMDSFTNEKYGINYVTLGYWEWHLLYCAHCYTWSYLPGIFVSTAILRCLLSFINDLIAIKHVVKKTKTANIKLNSKKNTPKYVTWRFFLNSIVVVLTKNILSDSER